MRLLWPLLAVLAASGAVSSYLGSRFTAQAYDAALLDSAFSLASQVRLVEGAPAVMLTREALEIFEWDTVDRVFFKVATPDGGLVAGLGGLPAASDAAGDEAAFFDARFERADIRGVTIRKALDAPGGAVLVTVAETVRKRHRLRRDILGIVLLPQLLVLALTFYLLRSGIDRGLSSLEAVVRDVATRDPADSRPIEAGALVQEIQPLIARFNGLLGRIGETIAAQRRFIADASHQLRTPLATLLLQIHNLRARPLPEEVAGELARVEGTAERAARLSRQLLALARTEPQLAPSQEFGPVDLASAVRAAGEGLIERASALGVELQIETPAAPVVVRGHAAALEEMAANLIDNALKHAGSGGIVKLAVSDGGSPRLVVEDRGPGIAPHELPRIFERFYRSAEARSEGAGLGLAIVQQIAAQHGASVSVETRPQLEGTRFTVVFKAPLTHAP